MLEVICEWDDRLTLIDLLLSNDKVRCVRTLANKKQAGVAVLTIEMEGQDHGKENQTPSRAEA